ncbi:hypothetical protein [Cohnella candidum]|uniref:Uncharacterized protein n=1 Tax=Cohnella candidum TaxID=2674991 RepID=A0A3G3JW81_9BACL|nr:hypothetical protein [Cohnella candidum]AYQ72492.1 hypothetical protein EAV92_07885 [Cohnella candidum]
MNDFEVIFREIKKDLGDIIKIEDYLVIENKKASIVLSTVRFMGSIEVLVDFTYDFFISHIESENSFRFKTIKFEKIIDLINEIKRDINDLRELECAYIEGSNFV